MPFAPPFRVGGEGAAMASKMGYESKLVRSFSRIEPQKLGLAVVAGCFAVSLLFIAVLRPPMNPSQIAGLRLRMPSVSRTMLVAEVPTNSTKLEDVGINNSTMDNKMNCGVSTCEHDKEDSVQEETSNSVPAPAFQESLVGYSHLPDDGRDDPTLGNRLECDGSLCKGEKGNVGGNSSMVVSVSPAPQENVTSSSSPLGSPSDKAEVSCDPQSGLCEVGGDSDVHASPPQSDSGNQSKAQEAELLCDPRSGICNIDENTGSQSSSLPKSGDEPNVVKENPMQRRQPLCDTSNPRFDFCDMAGDVRILGQSSSVFFVDDSPSSAALANESWRVRPYSRKGDNTALGHVREVLVTSLPSQQGGDALACAIKHDVPAVVFSVSGYTGNFFHDFTDVLIPLFLTTRPFNGEVQFLITDLGSWWVNKYRLIFNQLTRYEIINFDKEDKVHCFPRAIVGLRRHKELSIDPSKPPQGYSMPGFAKFMRTAFSLERDTVTRLEGRKPRLMIISRKRTRSLVNVRKVVQMAQKLGFEVVVGEMGVGSDVASFARLVNSCDVLMGVHGAGLTNLVFLPTNGTLIQIVPWGGLEWISNFDFGEPALDARLRYLQYKITAEESTLIQQYPRDHPVFKDPFSIHKQGWDALRSVFLDKQNVKLDVKRFRSVLSQVLDLLRRQ